ncbi:hypothetical protein HYFRA_00013567 [Hymenoscyphus fraxineus]|uniref:Sulfhydryl oxidase n=1 Tax=Hymenoscyphus fraxineus TaxID=746836 RepID=A0A9N9LB60_9HELO|nr:hypothetical protein HYFRA_00013567 [Hymenoscyphus fraxineus]
MADDTRENETKSTATPSAFPSEKPRRNAQGVILGKDGKPCRSCNSFASFTSQTKKITKSDPQCPPDVEQLGRSTWTFLHTLTASYPANPTPSEQSNVQQFMGLFGKLYPCWVCAEDFQEWMAKNKVRTESRDEFGRWMCEAHNEVNRKLGKREFDCGKWEERWRTGWKNGSCD